MAGHGGQGARRRAEVVITAPAPRPGTRDDRARLAANAAAEAHVLIVDDDPSKRLALKAVLAPLGCSVVEADSGRAALRCVLKQDFAVILLDVRMPEMDGFETAALIRQREASETTPIIFITAFGIDELPRQDLYAEGAVDFVFAPVPPDALRAKVSVFASLFRKAEDLAARAEEMQASAEQLRVLTDAAPVGIFQTDAEGLYVYTNPRWSEISGVSADDAAGRRWNSLLGAGAAGLVLGPASGSSSRDASNRVVIRGPDGASRTVVFTARSIAENDAVATGWVGTLTDVTAEVGAEAAMSEARDEANEASRLKSDFLANMSHEIRTPMNGVIGMTDLLLETDLDVRQRDYAQTVRNSGEALLAIINDILDFSKVEAGMLNIEDVEFELGRVLHDVVDLLAGPAQAKGLELVTAIEDSVPMVVSGDPGRVRQVLTNLIGNAVKFTESGEVVVRVGASTVDDDDTRVRFAITDTGNGIPSEKLDTIFQPFLQADTSTSRRHGGTGLGLAISSQLVTLMGGDCGVTSEVGAGSEFWFTIRVKGAAERGTARPPPPDPGLTGARVLIVDDNATQRQVLSAFLGGCGMTVRSASSKREALDLMRVAATGNTPFAVAVIDAALPRTDGVALSDAVIADPDLSTALVLMTTLGEAHSLEDSAKAGVAAFLTKPIHGATLRSCVRVALGLEIPQGDATRANTEDSTPGERGRGHLLLAEDNAINQKVAVAMLSSAGYSVDTVADGAAAVEAAMAASYDAILMDCQMPELNGYEATAAIRAHEGSARHTPIIALTAGARREDRERCLAEGMDSYLGKPVSKDALLASVARSMAAADPPRP
ncbi:MAG: two-component system, sensor histidine kinase and response regulator [Thermoleophilaceae bacterium]|nr:two-component system, sensor histidine kinase and response regulator [Thermoleophilaceae bacterium]